MNNEFGKILKELRTDRKISQIDLADSLKTSRAIITSWEDGSGKPPRESIKDIGKTLKLSTDDIDKLLSSVGYDRLTGNELVKLVRFNLSSAGLLIANSKETNTGLENFFNSTGTVIGGTIGSLDEKVRSIENQLEAILKPSNNSDVAEKIKNEINPLLLEVKAIKEEIVPQLEETKKQLSKSDEFIRKNADFFVSAVEGDGAIKVIKGEVASIEKRLDKVESQINVSRDRVIAIASVMIALISGCIACVSLAIPIYQFFSQ
jgi:transcriptional regulator with XRE-family HTH domain